MSLEFIYFIERVIEIRRKKPLIVRPENKSILDCQFRDMLFDGFFLMLQRVVWYCKQLKSNLD